jgi:hypothetical protein
MTTHVLPADDRARRANRLAWWSLALFPIAFVGAFLVGEGLFTLTGQDTGSDTTAPLWAVVVAGVPALAVFLAPGLVTIHFSRQAMRLGHSGAFAPMVIGLVVCGGFAALNVLSYVAGLVLLDR